MDRFDAMTVLLAAVDAGSLSAASRKLGMPLATVSRKVSELEAQIRTRLVTRTNRRLELTDAGRAYVAACRQIVAAVEEAERTAAGEYSTPQGCLIITAPIVFGRLHLLPIVASFLKAYPSVDVRLMLADRLVNLLEDHVDVALRIGHLPDSSLVAQRVGAIRLVACASPGYLAERGAPQAPADLSAHDCVTFDTLAAPRRWKFGTDKRPVTVPIRSRLVVNTAEAAIDAAIAGLGVTRVLSYQIADARRSGLLDIVLQAFEPEPSPVNLVYDGQSLLPLKLRAFLDHAVPRLKARIATTAV